MTTTTVLVAGATGMLGNRVAGHLLDRPDVAVRLLVRTSSTDGPGHSDAINSLPLEVAHALDGAFMDMMLDPSTPGLIDFENATVTLWGTGDEPFDLTTVDDTARFTARLATDPADVSGVRYLSGAQATFNEIIDESERLSGTTLTRSVLGTADDLRRITREASDPWSVMEEWYFLSLLTVPPFPTTENDRYPDARPIGLHTYLAAAHGALPRR